MFRDHLSMWPRLVLLISMYACSFAGSVSSASCVAPAEGQDMQEDWVSLLQMSAESGPRRDVPESPVVAVLDSSVSTDLPRRRARLTSRIAKMRVHLETTRSSLASMEAELALIDASQSEVGGSAQEKKFPDEAAAGTAAVPKHATALLEQIPDVTSEPMGLVSGDSAVTARYGSWMGIVSPQIQTTESYVIGQGCKKLKNIDNLGGPAALPNILSNKVTIFSNAGYKGYKLRDMVSNALAAELPGTGPWNVAAGSIDWNLYHEQGNTCTVAVKLPEQGLDWIVYGI